MASDLPQITQDQDSSRYFASDAEPLAEFTGDTDQFSGSTMSTTERATRYLSAAVLLLLISAGGGLCWQHRQAIISSAAELKKHSSSALDLVMWAKGSKKTFSEALTDRLSEPVFDASKMKPAYKTEFSNVDLQNLSSAWNGKHK